jgi:hypothetical protein
MAISYLDIARSGRCLPMTTDLVLNEGSDPEALRDLAAFEDPLDVSNS